MINGYPESKYQNNQNKEEQLKKVWQYGLTRTGYALDFYPETGIMVHRISTEAGQNGAPVIKI